jgi:hypothetical protein
MSCTWKKVDGKWQCQAKECIHYGENGKCKIGKVSLTCDNNDCCWNTQIDGHGIYVCQSMDVHLDANGKCLGFKHKM